MAEYYTGLMPNPLRHRYTRLLGTCVVGADTAALGHGGAFDPPATELMKQVVRVGGAVEKERNFWLG